MWLVEQIAKPVSRRLGSMLGGWLASQGVAGDTTQTIVAGVTALALVAVDLAFSALDKRGD